MRITLEKTPSAEFYYQSALEAIASKDYSLGILRLRDALGIEDNDKYAIELAEAYYKVGSFEESSLIYHKLLAKQPCYEYITCVTRNILRRGFKDVAWNFIVNSDDHLGRILSSKHKRMERIYDEYIVDDFILEEKTERLRRYKFVGDVRVYDGVNVRARKIMSEIKTAIAKDDLDKVIGLALRVERGADEYTKALSVLVDAAVTQGDLELAKAKYAEFDELDKESKDALHLAYRMHDVGLLDEVSVEETEKRIFEVCLKKNDYLLMSDVAYIALRGKRFEYGKKLVDAGRDIMPMNAWLLRASVLLEYMFGGDGKAEKLYKTYKRAYGNTMPMFCWILDYYLENGGITRDNLFPTLFLEQPEKLVKKSIGIIGKALKRSKEEIGEHILSRSELDAMGVILYGDANLTISFILKSLPAVIRAFGEPVTNMINEVISAPSALVDFPNKITLMTVYMMMPEIAGQFTVCFNDGLTNIFIRHPEQKKGGDKWIFESYKQAFTMLTIAGFPPKIPVFERVAEKIIAKKNDLYDEFKYLSYTLQAGYLLELGIRDWEEISLFANVDVGRLYDYLDYYGIYPKKTEDSPSEE